jgi:prefoldin subunit 5
MIMANKKPVPLKDEEIDTLDELQDKLQTCIDALNSLSSCQTVCPYTHAVFLGFVYWIDAIFDKREFLFIRCQSDM